MSVRKVKGRNRWAVDYVDEGGVRRLKSFLTRSEADAFASTIGQSRDCDLEMPWGAADSRRGIQYHSIAVKFFKRFVGDSQFPVQLSEDKLDTFLLTNELIDTPPKRASSGWQAHVRRRQFFRTNISKAGCHPRMAEAGYPPFVIEYLGHHQYSIESPENVARNTNVPREVYRKHASLERGIRYKMQGASWENLPVMAREVAQEFYRHQSMYLEEQKLLTNNHMSRLADIERRWKRALTDQSSGAR